MDELPARAPKAHWDTFAPPHRTADVAEPPAGRAREAAHATSPDHSRRESISYGTWEEIVVSHARSHEHHIATLRAWARAAHPEQRADAEAAFEFLSAGARKALSEIAAVDLPLARMLDGAGSSPRRGLLSGERLVELLGVGADRELDLCEETLLTSLRRAATLGSPAEKHRARHAAVAERLCVSATPTLRWWVLIVASDLRDLSRDDLRDALARLRDEAFAIHGLVVELEALVSDGT